MVGDEAVPRDGAGASPLATAEAEGAFGDRGSPGLQEGRELTSRDDLAQRPRTDDLRAVWGLSGVPPPNPEEKEAALDQEGASRHREGLGWGGGRPLRGLRPTVWAGCASPIDSGRVSPGPLSGHQKQDANEFPAMLGPRGGGSRPPHCPSGGQLAFLPPRGNLRRAPGLVRDSGGRRQPKYR